MGAESTCTARFKGKTASGKARLETDVLQFRGGDLRLSIPFDQMSRITARGGTLSVTFQDGTASFDLGTAAPKWVDKIRHPPSRLQKLGAKPEWRVSAIGVDDEAFLADAFRFESLDQFSELAQRKPVNGSGVLLYLRKRLFLDRNDHHLDALASCGFENQKRKPSKLATPPKRQPKEDFCFMHLPRNDSPSEWLIPS